MVDLEGAGKYLCRVSLNLKFNTTHGLIKTKLSKYRVIPTLLALLLLTLIFQLASFIVNEKNEAVNLSDRFEDKSMNI